MFNAIRITRIIFRIVTLLVVVAVGLGCATSQAPSKEDTTSKPAAQMSTASLELQKELFTAVKKRNREVAARLLEEHPDLVFARDKDGMTPLQWAAKRGDVESVKLLLSHKADVNAKDNRGVTPLHEAGGFITLRPEYREIVDLLLVNKAEFTIHDATLLGDVKRVRDILLANPDLVFRKDSLGITPLHLAAYPGNKELVELFLANKADVNAKTKFGLSPLHFAAIGGDGDVVKLLLSHHADVNSQTVRGESPLHLSAVQGHKEVMELFLAGKADVNARDIFGKTPLHRAVDSSPKKPLVVLLLAHNADLNARSNDGETPLRLAESCGQKEIADLLRQHGAKE